MTASIPERERYAIGECLLDVDAATLQRDGQPIPLTGLTFDLLVCLARHAPAVVSRDTLLDEVWRDANVGEETLKQRVRLLRKTLGDDSKAPTFVATVRGKGYRLIPKVARIAAGGPTRQRESRPMTRRLAVFAVVAMVIAAGWVVAWRWQPGPSPESLSAQPNAMELYERGRLYYRRYLPKANTMAIELLLQALEADPGFAKAHALLSRAYSQQPKLGNGYWGKQAKAAAQKAIDLDGEEADGYVALGVYYDVAGKPQKGIQAYKQALDRRPDYGDAWSNAACDFLVLGQLVEAATWNAKGLRLNPEGHFGKVQMGDILRLLGREAEAAAWLEKAVALQPDNIFARTSLSKLRMLNRDWSGALSLFDRNFQDPSNQGLADFGRGLVYFFKGDLEAAKPFFQAANDMDLRESSYRLALIDQLAGTPGAAVRVAEVEAEIAKIVASGVRFPANEVRLATLAAVDGRPEEAMTWLKTACERGFTDVSWLENDPALASVKGRGDFRDLIGALEARLAAMRARLGELDVGLGFTPGQ